MTNHLKPASGGTAESAVSSSRAGSTQAIKKDTEVKVEVKRVPGIDVFEKGDHVENDLMVVTSTTMEEYSEK